jgi:outer membrane protein
MKHWYTKIAAVALLLSPALEAAAQAFMELDTVPAIVGAGVGFAPDYRGSDDRTGVIAPFARYTFARSNRYIQLNATELTLNVIDSASIRFGPVLNYHPGRDSDIDDELVKRMAEIDGTVEAGVFGEVAWIERGNPRNRFIVGVTLLKDIGGESDGFRARLNARYWRQLAPAVDLHVGGGLTYADSSYTSHYFSVTPQNVGTSGLPFFSAGSGVNEYFITLGALTYFSRNWLGVAGLRAAKISGDAKDSPVVSQRGDSTQLIGGVGIGYMWR